MSFVKPTRTIEYCTVQCSGEAYRQNPPWEISGNSSSQACHGDDESGMKNAEIAPGKCGSVPGKRKENCSCHCHHKQGAGTSSGY